VRTKGGRRYTTTIGSATFAVNAEGIGISGEFDGGWALVTGWLTANVGAGQWINVMVMVDGVLTTANAPGAYQSGASVTGWISEVVRVPNGRHRIGLRFGAGVTPTGGQCGGQLHVLEL